VVSYGYDRIRFIKPVRVGDTITVTYEIASQDLESSRTFGTVTATNQHQDVVAVATHILKFL
jgi:3-hydroxybutyryl-CoA dehydratase